MVTEVNIQGVLSKAAVSRWVSVLSHLASNHPFTMSLWIHCIHFDFSLSVEQLMSSTRACYRNSP